MNNHEYIVQLLPDYINGTLSESDKHLVEQSLASTPELNKEYHEFLEVFNAIKKNDVIRLMNDESQSFHMIIPVKNKIVIPKIMIGVTTSIAACLLLWIGINNQVSVKVEKGKMVNTSNIQIADVLEDYSPLDIQSEDLEEVILDDILTVYVSDIESGREINPLLEEEITNYLLKENQDEETL